MLLYLHVFKGRVATLHQRLMGILPLSTTQQSGSAINSPGLTHMASERTEKHPQTESYLRLEVPIVVQCQFRVVWAGLAV
jgi:hypothetical protein